MDQSCMEQTNGCFHPGPDETCSRSCHDLLLTKMRELVQDAHSWLPFNVGVDQKERTMTQLGIQLVWEDDVFTYVIECTRGGLVARLVSYTDIGFLSTQVLSLEGFLEMIVLSDHHWFRLIYSTAIPASLAEEHIYPCGGYTVGGPLLPLLQGPFGISCCNQDNTVIGIDTQLRLIGDDAVFPGMGRYLA